MVSPLSPEPSPCLIFMFAWFCVCVYCLVGMFVCTDASMCGVCLHRWGIQVRGQSWVSFHSTLVALMFETGSLHDLKFVPQGCLVTQSQESTCLHISSTGTANTYKHIQAHLAFLYGLWEWKSGLLAHKASSHGWVYLSSPLYNNYTLYFKTFLTSVRNVWGILLPTT